MNFQNKEFQYIQTCLFLLFLGLINDNHSNVYYSLIPNNL